jgi:hypothetical protein
MQSSPLPCYLVPLKPKYPLQHRIIENLQRKDEYLINKLKLTVCSEEILNY